MATAITNNLASIKRYEDVVDAAKPAIDALTTCLVEITDLAACSVAPPATVATSPDDLDLDGIAASPSSVPRKQGHPSPETPKDVPLNERLLTRAKLTNLGVVPQPLPKPHGTTVWEAEGQGDPP